MNSQDYRILIVDDEPANVYLLSRMLRDSYRIVEAHGGEDALSVAHGPDKPALILLDVMMPEIDGFEVCRRLKADDETKDIIVIFVTAIGDSAAEEVGLNLGAADYITKPISLPIVRARVRNQINMRLKADMLEAMSYIDGLTHVYNRRKFDTLLQKEWQRARRSGKPLALIMIDFDHFKALNDHYGHGAGDICLQQGAAALNDALKRQSDLLARYGGEEFVALLPETDMEGARMTAEAMRAAVKDLNLAHKYSTAADHVTVSLGVAAAQADDEHQASHLLELADRALNRAKATGRDRAVLMDAALETELGEAEVAAPEASDDALAKAESTKEDAGSAKRWDQISALELERRRYGADLADCTDHWPQPPAEKVLSTLSECYRLPLSAELHAELDSVFDAANALLARLNAEYRVVSEDGDAISESEDTRMATAFSVSGAASEEGDRKRFDLNELMRRLDDDQAIAAATIEQFLADVPSRLQDLRAARRDQDADALHFKAHSLKGLAGAVSATRLQRLAERLEKSASNHSGAAELVDRIDEEYALLEPLLRAQLGA